MAAGAAIPGLFFVFAAAVLLVFVRLAFPSRSLSYVYSTGQLTQASVSAPTWNSVSFLNTEGIHFGVFGYTGSDTHVGYRFPNPIGYVARAPFVQDIG